MCIWNTFAFESIRYYVFNNTQSYWSCTISWYFGDGINTNFFFGKLPLYYLRFKRAQIVGDGCKNRPLPKRWAFWHTHASNVVFDMGIYDGHRNFQKKAVLILSIKWQFKGKLFQKGLVGFGQNSNFLDLFTFSNVFCTPIWLWNY